MRRKFWFSACFWCQALMQIEAVFTSIRIQSEEKITCIHSMIRAMKYGGIHTPLTTGFKWNNNWSRMAVVRWLCWASKIACRVALTLLAGDWIPFYAKLSTFAHVKLRSFYTDPQFKGESCEPQTSTLVNQVISIGRLWLASVSMLIIAAGQLSRNPHVHQPEQDYITCSTDKLINMALQVSEKRLLSVSSSWSKSGINIDCGSVVWRQCDSKGPVLTFVKPLSGRERSSTRPAKRSLSMKRQWFCSEVLVKLIIRSNGHGILTLADTILVC